MKHTIHYFFAFSLMLTSCAVEDVIESQEPYIWSVSQVTGDVNRYYIYPSYGGNGPSADVGVYLNSTTGIGSITVTCRVYNGSTYLGSASKYIYIN